MATKRGRKSSGAWIEVVDACYAPAADHATWAANVVAAAMPTLSYGPGLGFSLFEEAQEARTLRVAVARGEIGEVFLRLTDSASKLESEAYRAMYHPPNLVVRASTAFRSAAGSQAFLRQAKVDGAFADAVGLLMYPGRQSVAVLTTFMGRDAPISRGTRERMHQLRRHLESGLRLRLRDAEAPLAVFSADGKVVHAAGDARAAHVRHTLRAQAQRIEEMRAASDDSLNPWQALVRGRWTLVSRTERDGKRYYFAYENAPESVPYRALTPVECRVVHRLLRGDAPKSVAYDVGLSPAAVSRALWSAIHKLGLRSDVELFRIGADLSASSPRLQRGLTDGEQEILDSLRQGRTNAEIARLRGTSVHTVANQVASMLRKCGVSSRRELWALSGVRAE